MTAAHWFLASLPVVALSVMFGGHLWGGAALLILILSRIWALRSVVTWWVVVVLCLVFGTWFSWQATQLSRRRYPVAQPQTVTTTLRVQPDSPVVYGSGYTVIGQKPSGERVLVHGTLRSAAELRRLTHLTRPTLWRISGQQAGLLAAPNFNQFDAAAYWGHRGIANTLKAGAMTIQPTTGHGLTWWQDSWHGLRSRLIQYCERLPGALRIYALGLFPGKRASDSPQELAGMQQLGLIHLFAISGLHVALVLAVAEWGLIHARLPREWWEWVLLLGLPGYAILAGGGSGVLRACWMRGFQLAGRRCHQSVSPLTAWTWALLVGLWVNPGLLFELGGQLSYGLSLALILLAAEPLHWREIGLTLLGVTQSFDGAFSVA